MLWRSPENIASRNLLYGSGGKQDEPRPPFTFLKEDLDGTNPKFDVRDQDEVKWKVKLGAEARSETVATRFLWAVGYFTDEDYFISNTRVEDMPRQLKRGQRLVEPGGVVRNVRLEREPKGKKIETWQWRHNLFTGTRELNGLRVMMALINNWDLKNQNNAIYSMSSDGDAPEGSQQIYMISDLGASLARRGSPGPRVSPGITWSNTAIRGLSPRSPPTTSISRRLAGRRSCIHLACLNSSRGFVYAGSAGTCLAPTPSGWDNCWPRLSPDQIRDAFRAAGYSPQEVEGFAKVIEARIAELEQTVRWPQSLRSAASW